MGMKEDRVQVSRNRSQNSEAKIIKHIAHQSISCFFHAVRPENASSVFLY
jgi:hypothetical protein